MRIVDLQLSFPSILIALVLLAVLGQGVDKIVIALVTVQWAYYARTVRGERARGEAQGIRRCGACASAYGRWRILYRHILPNCLPPLIVVATVQVAHAIALEATLSFLGLGMPITSPSLGLLIANGYAHLLSGSYWISFFPGVALLVTIVAINLVGDHLRDVLNPRLQTERGATRTRLSEARTQRLPPRGTPHSPASGVASVVGRSGRFTEANLGFPRCEPACRPAFADSVRVNPRLLDDRRPACRSRPSDACAAPPASPCRAAPGVEPSFASASLNAGVLDRGPAAPRSACRAPAWACPSARTGRATPRPRSL